MNPLLQNPYTKMPDLLDQVYCSEQIFIPPSFPYLMKLYCKAAIRTQPYDLLKWSAAYFRALANGEEPPVKERIEFPPYQSTSGITPGYLRILIRQFGKSPETTVTAQILFKKWNEICLDEMLLVKIIALLGASTAINWVKFVGVCAGFISPTLTQTMILICELFTDEPEGGMATIPYELFIDLYLYLAEMECGPLTEKEKLDQEAIMDEEDICEVVDKIKQGLYEDEEEERLSIEGEELEEDILAIEEVAEEEKVEEEEEEEKEEEEAIQEMDEEETPQTLSKGEDDEDKEEDDYQDKKEAKMGEEEEGGDEKLSDKSKEGESDKSGQAPLSLEGEESQDIDDRAFSTQGDMKSEERKPSKSHKSSVSYGKALKLENLDEAIRARIEEKLDEEEGEESVFDEDNKEFEYLSSYLLGAATREQKLTAEALGYKIFKKCRRQEIPGIGPRVETEQVEKVVNFMDYWSHKQELMVMPRNIRHWMCPSLDKVSPGM